MEKVAGWSWKVWFETVPGRNLKILKGPMPRAKRPSNVLRRFGVTMQTSTAWPKKGDLRVAGSPCWDVGLWCCWEGIVLEVVFVLRDE